MLKMKAKLPMLIILAMAVFLAGCSSKNYDSFATCIAESGTTFYGAFWCPHCQAQKSEFGGSAKLLPYVECSTPDGKAQRQECIDQKVEKYPTWEFPDGSRVTGEQSLETLSAKTGCAIGE